MLVTYRGKYRGKWWDPYSCENVPMLMQVLSEMFRDLLSPAPCVSAVIKGALPRVSVVSVSWSLSCLYTRMLLLLSRFSRVRLCATPQTAAHQAPPSLGFSGKEHRSGLPFPSPVHEGEKWKWSCSVVSDSSWPHGLQPTRLLRPWDFPGKSTGVGCHCFLKNDILPIFTAIARHTAAVCELTKLECPSGNDLLPLYHMTQQSLCWAYTLRKPEVKKTHVPRCSLQHYLQWLGHGSKLAVHQQMNG